MLKTSASTSCLTWSAFANDQLLLIGNAFTLIGIATDTLSSYPVVPNNGRIPNPQSPSISPDGTSLVFSDFCGADKSLYIARVDGKTGDTCGNAFPLATYPGGLLSASWGPNGYIAARRAVTTSCYSERTASGHP